MDPDSTYADLIAAMAAGSYVVARQLARGLQAWLAQGGPWPQCWSREEVRVYLASVEYRTRYLASAN